MHARTSEASAPSSTLTKLLRKHESMRRREQTKSHLLHLVSPLPTRPFRLGLVVSFACAITVTWFPEENGMLLFRLSHKCKKQVALERTPASSSTCSPSLASNILYILLRSSLTCFANQRVNIMFFLSQHTAMFAPTGVKLLVLLPPWKVDG